MIAHELASEPKARGCQLLVEHLFSNIGGSGQGFSVAFVRLFLVTVCYFGFYISTDLFCSRLSLGFAVSPFYLPAGVAVLGSVVLGPLFFPVLLLVEYFSAFVSFPTGLPLLANLLWPPYKMLLYVVEGVVIVHGFKVDLRFSTVKSLTVFCAVLSVTHSVLGLSFTGVLWMSGISLDYVDVVNFTLTWVFGDLSGILSATVPVLLLLPMWSTSEQRLKDFMKETGRQRLAGLVVATFILVAGALAGIATSPASVMRLYLSPVPASFVAFHFGTLGAALVVSFLNIVIVIIYEVQQFGVDVALELQIFFVIHTIVSLVLGMACLQSREQTKKVKALNEDMEKKHSELSMLADALMQTNEDLEKARSHAVRMVSVKTSFLNNVSHEIRTPLHGIMGYCNLLLDSNLDSTQLRWGKTVAESANLLKTILDNVLDASKLEVATNERLMDQVETFSLQNLLEGSVAMLASMATGRLDLMSYISPDCCDVVVRSNRLALQRVVLNLLSNALKYTNEGWVCLEAHGEVTLPPTREAPGELAVQISVSDSGIGIKAADLKRLFRQFSQLAEKDEANYRGGTGLGLALSQELVRAMGGEITVSSEVGRGSVFEFALAMPCLSPDAKATGKLPKVVFSPPTDAAERGARLAVVVWSPVLRACRLFEDILLSYFPGALVTCIDDVKALGAAIADQKTRRGGEGVVRMAFVDEAAWNFYCGEGVALVGVCHDSGSLPASFRASATVPKPLVATNIASCVVSVMDAWPDSIQPLRELQSKEKAAKGSMKYKEVKARVLLAEDNTTNRIMVDEMLHNFGITTVVAACNGKEAVSYFEDNLAMPFDLILMDQQMPVVDGVAATKQIRQIESRMRCKRTPIIAFTADTDAEAHLSVTALANIDGFLNKPFTNAEVFDVLQKWLPNFHSPEARPGEVDGEVEDQAMRMMKGGRPVQNDLDSSLDNDAIRGLEDFRRALDNSWRSVRMSEAFSSRLSSGDQSLKSINQHGVSRRCGSSHRTNPVSSSKSNIEEESSSSFEMELDRGNDMKEWDDSQPLASDRSMTNR